MTEQCQRISSNNRNEKNRGGSCGEGGRTNKHYEITLHSHPVPFNNSTVMGKCGGVSMLIYVKHTRTYKVIEERLQ